jgi:fluoride exporter
VPSPPERNGHRHLASFTHPVARELLAIFAGGALGGLARCALVTTLSTPAPGWPWATFLVNVTGTFALGYAGARLVESTYRRRLIGTGFCGAYTTFSTMQLEVLVMLDHQRYGLAGAYVLTSVLAGLAAIRLGGVLARRTRVIA